MQPKRSWRTGDSYWALWLNANSNRYFPHLEGAVASVRRGIIRLRDGGWRYVDEGLPFGSRLAAEAYAEANEPPANDGLAVAS